MLLSVSWGGSLRHVFSIRYISVAGTQVVRVTGWSQMENSPAQNDDIVRPTLRGKTAAADARKERRIIEGSLLISYILKNYVLI